MRRFLVRTAHPILRRWYSWWNASRREVRVDGLVLTVLPGVFHPQLFHSTRLLAEHVLAQPLAGRTLLELGAGAGRLSLLAARQGALVTASDLNPAAVESLRINGERARLAITVVLSDLFDRIPGTYEIIAINPPYYPKAARTPAEQAFNSGEGHAYFQRLFPVLADRLRSGTAMFMVLSEDLDRAPIAAIAQASGLELQAERSASRWGETSTVFRILPAVPGTLSAQQGR